MADALVPLIRLVHEGFRFRTLERLGMSVGERLLESPQHRAGATRAWLKGAIRSNVAGQFPAVLNGWMTTLGCACLSKYFLRIALATGAALSPPP